MQEWYTGRCSSDTRPLEKGFYIIRIINAFDINDAKYFMNPGWNSGEDFLSYLKIRSIIYIKKEK